MLQPFRQLGWWQWMYRLSPYTYLIEGLLGQGTFTHSHARNASADNIVLIHSDWKTRHYLLFRRTSAAEPSVWSNMLAVSHAIYECGWWIHHEPGRY